MLKISFVVISIWILSVYRLKCEKQEEYIIKLYKVSCSVEDNGYFAPNYSCAVKAVDRHTGVANIHVWIVKVLKNITVHLQLFKLYSQFRPYLINLTYSYCDIMAHTFIPNFYIHIFMRMLENKTNALRECPFSGYVYFKGLTMEAAKLKLPIFMGRYKLTLLLYEGHPMKFIAEISYFAEAYKKPTPRNRGNKTKNL